MGFKVKGLGGLGLRAGGLGLGCNVWGLGLGLKTSWNSSQRLGLRD